jgi:alpha-galactosidase
VSDVWRRDLGVAVGHLETTPKLVSLPVRFVSRQHGAEVSVEYEYDFEVAQGDSISTIETFIFAHEGDYYAALKNYRHAMAMKGLKIADAPDSAYEAIWCAWGYERNFSVAEVRNTLPKVRELGLKWAVLDDGWQTAEGDWYLNPEKFPNGTPDMQALVSDIKDADLKAKLWWAPLAVDPGTDLIEQHEDMLLLNEDGSRQDITWWDSYYLCPAYDKTIEYSKNLVTKYMKEWGFQGLKIDGQHLNGVPKCYNPKHHHERPEESVEKLQEFWNEIYKTALSIDKEAVVEICPCGTSYAFFNLPYMNQSVSSDPLSSWQVRLKGKTIKALAGESAAYYGDHVELSDEQNDFASTVGIGAVVGTKFTLPSDNEAAAQLLLTANKEAVWKKWIGIYNEKMLPKGEYLGELYDIGFDRPEAHAIRKDGSIFYAFYAVTFRGDVELRGLGAGKYQLLDYVNDKDFGVVDGPAAKLQVDFARSLLIEARPVRKP